MTNVHTQKNQHGESDQDAVVGLPPAVLTGRNKAKEAKPALALILRLLDAFNSHAIKVCYWKSARHVGEALAGDKDLDLLVGREDQHRIAALLLATGFKTFPSIACRDHPSITSHVGYDAPSGKLIHVHLHLRLVVGHSLLKSLRLPWEDVLVARSVRSPNVPIAVLDPAADVVILMSRSLLDMNKSDVIVQRDWHRLLDRYRSDIRAARLATSMPEVTWIACRLYGDVVGRQLAAAIYEFDPLHRTKGLSRKLRRHIAHHQIYGPTEMAVCTTIRTVRALIGRWNRHVHAPRPWHRRAPGGGLVIAIVGLDGSGKSTMVAMVRQWLGSEVDVMPIYFGTGDGRPSLFLVPFKLLVPLAERMFRRRPIGSSHGDVTNKRPSLGYSLAMAFWATLVAIEKRGKLKRARCAAARGMVVVADRYPQNEIPTFNDGPLLHRLTWIPAILRRFEEQSYDRVAMLPPDLVIKLVVTGPTAMAREPTMNPAVIHQRIDEFASLKFPGAEVVAINAEQPLTNVIADVKRIVWGAL